MSATEPMTGDAVFAFSEDNLVSARAIIAKYPPGRQASALLPLLDLAQRQGGGWLPRAALDYVADFLEMPRIRVYEVATFYTMFNLKPIGRHHVQVCTNLPCALSGGNHAAEYLQKKLGIGFNETTPDGKFTLKEGECMGACGDAPVFIVNNRSMCSHMHPDQIDKLLEECK